MNNLTGKELKQYIKRNIEYFCKDISINGDNVLMISNEGKVLMVFVLNSRKQVTPAILKLVEEFTTSGVQSNWCSNLAEWFSILDTFEGTQ